MILVVHPGSQIPDPDADFLPIPDPGSRGQKGTRSRILDPGSGSATLLFFTSKDIFRYISRKPSNFYFEYFKYIKMFKIQ
jgi:hypothetical protein